MSEDKNREEGFRIFRNGLVRRLSSTHYAARSQANEPWYLIELREGKWNCDCKSADPACVHLYAAQLCRTTSKLPADQVDETHLKCRYCSSPDVARCGFRYNARGIVRRYRCNDCQRKFSIPHVQNSSNAEPNEIVWLLNEVGLLTSKLTELLSELDSRIGDFDIRHRRDYGDSLPHDSDMIKEG